jgi:hypothetical protein
MDSQCEHYNFEVNCGLNITLKMDSILCGRVPADRIKETIIRG